MAAAGQIESYRFIDLHLTKDEMDGLNGLEINDIKEYNRFGDLERLSEELPKFFASLGTPPDDSRIAIASAAVQRIVDIAVKQLGQPTAWVLIRAFPPISEFKIPRWHTDGYYTHPFSGPAYKFGVALRGASTLFYPLLSEDREKFDALQRADDREGLAEWLPVASSIRPPPGMGALFAVGDTKWGAVHSEPDITEKRLFLAVVPSTEEGIEEHIRPTFDSDSEQVTR